MRWNQATANMNDISRRKLTVAIASSLAMALLLAPANAWTAEAAKCDAAATQAEMNACAAADLAAADKQLNEVYQALLKKEAKNTAFITKLRAAQRTWVAFRDAELTATYACAELNPQACWGSMLPLRYSSYKAKLTRERTGRLRQLLAKGLPADD
jgi:uncharacterized protein YecT (DUF1311 family)